MNKDGKSITDYNVADYDFVVEARERGPKFTIGEHEIEADPKVSAANRFSFAMENEIIPIAAGMGFDDVMLRFRRTVKAALPVEDGNKTVDEEKVDEILKETDLRILKEIVARLFSFYNYKSVEYGRSQCNLTDGEDEEEETKPENPSQGNSLTSNLQRLRNKRLQGSLVRIQSA